MTACRPLPMLTILLCAANARPANATVVVPMTVAQMADQAAQVIDAVVDDVTSFRSADGTTIRTRIRFARTVYLKGRLPDSTEVFELVVPGGVVGDTQLRLTGAPRFAVGDRWLLLLHPTYNIHPVVGIHCGALRLETDSDGVVRVRDCGGRAIVGIDERGYLRTVDARPAPAIKLGTTSPGVTPINTVAQTNTAAMRLGEFVNLLSPILADSRAHTLDGPAGRLQRKTATAVPLSVRSAQDKRP